MSIYKRPGDGSEIRINALSLFIKNVEPKWEDYTNKKGGEFRINFVVPTSTVQTVWETLVFDIMVQEFPEVKMLAGVRILDKSTEKQASTFRMEVWTKFSDRKSYYGERIEKYLRENIITEMIKPTEKL